MSYFVRFFYLIFTLIVYSFSQHELFIQQLIKREKLGLKKPIITISPLFDHNATINPKDPLHFYHKHFLILNGNRVSLNYNGKLTSLAVSLDKEEKIYDFLCSEEGIYIRLDDYHNIKSKMKKGNLIVSAAGYICNKTSKGLYQKIQDDPITVKKGIIFLKTKTLNFLECFEFLHVNLLYHPSGRSPPSSRKRFNFDQNYNFNFYSSSPLYVNLYNSENLNASIECNNCYDSLDIELQFQLDWSCSFFMLGCGVNNFLLQFTGSNYLNIEPELEISISSQNPISLYKFNVFDDSNIFSTFFFMGVVPFYIEFGGGFDIDFKLLKAEAEFSYSQQFSFYESLILGVRYTQGNGWQNLNSIPAPQWTSTSPEIQINASASLEVDFEIKVTMDVDFLVGIVLEFVPYIQFNWNFPSQQCQQGIHFYTESGVYETTVVDAIFNLISFKLNTIQIVQPFFLYCSFCQKCIEEPKRNFSPENSTINYLNKTFSTTGSNGTTGTSTTGSIGTTGTSTTGSSSTEINYFSEYNFTDIPIAPGIIWNANISCGNNLCNSSLNMKNCINNMTCNPLYNISFFNSTNGPMWDFPLPLIPVNQSIIYYQFFLSNFSYFSNFSLPPCIECSFTQHFQCQIGYICSITYEIIPIIYLEQGLFTPFFQVSSIGPIFAEMKLDPLILSWADQIIVDINSTNIFLSTLMGDQNTGFTNFLSSQYIFINGSGIFSINTSLIENNNLTMLYFTFYSSIESINNLFVVPYLTFSQFSFGIPFQFTSLVENAYLIFTVNVMYDSGIFIGCFTSSGNPDLVILYYLPNGNLSWLTGYGSENNEIFNIEPNILYNINNIYVYLYAQQNLENGIIWFGNYYFIDNFETGIPINAQYLGYLNYLIVKVPLNFQNVMVKISSPQNRSIFWTIETLNYSNIPFPNSNWTSSSKIFLNQMELGLANYVILGIWTPPNGCNFTDCSYKLIEQNSIVNLIIEADFYYTLQSGIPFYEFSNFSGNLFFVLHLNNSNSGLTPLLQITLSIVGNNSKVNYLVASTNPKPNSTNYDWIGEQQLINGNSVICIKTSDNLLNNATTIYITTNVNGNFIIEALYGWEVSNSVNQQIINIPEKGIINYQINLPSDWFGIFFNYTSIVNYPSVFASNDSLFLNIQWFSYFTSLSIISSEINGSVLYIGINAFVNSIIKVSITPLLQPNLSLTTTETSNLLIQRGNGFITISLGSQYNFIFVFEPLENQTKSYHILLNNFKGSSNESTAWNSIVLPILKNCNFSFLNLYTLQIKIPPISNYFTKNGETITLMLPPSLYQPSVTPLTSSFYISGETINNAHQVLSNSLKITTFFLIFFYFFSE